MDLKMLNITIMLVVTLLITGIFSLISYNKKKK